MQNKGKNWTDIQMIISSISMAVTLGLWSLFAAPGKTGTGVPGQADVSSAIPTSTPTSSVPSQLLPGQKYIFAGATKTQSTYSAPRRHKGGGGGSSGGGSVSSGGGGGGGGGSSTGSSKP